MKTNLEIILFYFKFKFRYCLIAAPDEWTLDLRKRFIAGFKAFIEFLKFMHVIINRSYFSVFKKKLKS